MGENPSCFKGRPDNPVENVSWDDCRTFLEKLNALPEVVESGTRFRFPTEEEWDFACRAKSRGFYSRLSDGTEIAENSLDDVAWFQNNAANMTHPVGQKSRTPSGSTTCAATYGNGLRPDPCRSASIAEAVGNASQPAADRSGRINVRLSFVTTISVFVSALPGVRCARQKSRQTRRRRRKTACMSWN